MKQKQPTLFVSHGSPDILLRQTAAAEALRALGKHEPEPSGIVIVSAHWISNTLAVTSGGVHRTIHDFVGFPRALYSMHYGARGDETLSTRVAQALERTGLAVELVPDRGLDHGAWAPLALIYPEAHIPVVQVSLPARSLQDVANLGVALAPLRTRGIRLIGSGSTVHNLHAMNPQNRTDSWAVEFETWLQQTIEGNHFERLIDIEQFPDSFRQAHPTLEHYAPIVFSWAAAGSDKPGRRIHHSFDYGNIGMGMFIFGEH